MSFIVDAVEVAETAINAIDPTLSDKYVNIIKLLTMNPNAASPIRGKSAPKPGTKEYIIAQAQSFSSSRVPKEPKKPTTVPDEMVSFILENYFNLPKENLERAKQEHLLSMAAENLIGYLLERYLASVMEPRGWTWCSGSTVKAVDFIKPPTGDNEKWVLLQVKNRDNSENSSSSAIRNGTEIKKWFRTFSRQPKFNWSAFPDAEILPLISEEGFRSYVKDYLEKLKANS